jgi:hypothetical protein
MLRVLFIALALAIGALFVAGVRISATRIGASTADANRLGTRAAIGVALWLAITAGVAAARLLHFMPPTMPILIVAGFVLAFRVALSPLGHQLAVGLPLAVLVGFQAFRVLVELLLHRAYFEGLMPVQMSYSGRNFDIVSGITAIFMAIWLVRGHPSARIVFAWNTLGVGLLLNIVVIAMLSAPTPFRVFMNEPANVWITHAPWVWLPTVMVTAAIVGHVLVYRRLRQQ